jgi:hypothetical protein
MTVPHFDSTIAVVCMSHAALRVETSQQLSVLVRGPGWPPTLHQVEPVICQQLKECHY